MDDALLHRYADLIVEVGANVQPGQTVWIVAEPRAAPLARLVAAAAYERGARFVDPWYFDPVVKRIRLERAAEDTLGFVPSWYGRRLVDLGEGHGVRISITPQVPPGLLAGIDPARAGQDALPALAENFDVINAKTTNWTVVPWPSPEWARLVHPGVDDDTALARLWEQLIFVLRLDEPDPAAAWHSRLAQLHEAGKRVDAYRFDALRFEGPGTDLTVGLLPTLALRVGDARDADGRRRRARAEPPDRGDRHVARSDARRRRRQRDEAARRRRHGDPRPARALRGRTRGRDRAATAPRRCAPASAKDEGASRLGEVALVDREGRIGKTGTVFFNTLLDENAASHIALGNAYAIAGRRGGRRPDQHELDPHRLHDRLRRRLRHRRAPATAARCRCYAAATGRSDAVRRRGLGGRAPALTSCGSPRSANGTSITSKSRGTTVAGKTSRASSRELLAEVARRDVRQREQAHAGVARDLGGLQRGRVQRLRRAVALLLRERRLVDQHVGAFGEHAHGLDRRRVAGDHDAPPRPRLAEDGVGRQHAAVGQRHRLAALQRAAFRAERDAERVGRLDVEAAGPDVLDERVADRRDAVVHREDEDAVAVTLRAPRPARSSTSSTG